MGAHIYTNGAWTNSGKIYRDSENLFDEIYVSHLGPSVVYKAIHVGDGLFTLSSDIPLFQGAGQLFLIAGQVVSGAATGVNDVYNGVSRSVSSINGYVTIGYRQYSESAPDVADYKVMLNAGSNPMPYEPYNVVDWYTNTGHGYSSGAWS